MKLQPLKPQGFCRSPAPSMHVDRNSADAPSNPGVVQRSCRERIRRLQQPLGQLPIDIAIKLGKERQTECLQAQVGRSVRGVHELEGLEERRLGVVDGTGGAIRSDGGSNVSGRRKGRIIQCVYPLPLLVQEQLCILTKAHS